MQSEKIQKRGSVSFFWLKTMPGVIAGSPDRTEFMSGLALLDIPKNSV